MAEEQLRAHRARAAVAPAPRAEDTRRADSLQVLVGGDATVPRRAAGELIQDGWDRKLRVGAARCVNGCQSVERTPLRCWHVVEIRPSDADPRRGSLQPCANERQEDAMRTGGGRYQDTRTTALRWEVSPSRFTDSVYCGPELAASAAAATAVASGIGTN